MGLEVCCISSVPRSRACAFVQPKSDIAARCVKLNSDSVWIIPRHDIGLLLVLSIDTLQRTKPVMLVPLDATRGLISHRPSYEPSVYFQLFLDLQTIYSSCLTRFVLSSRLRLRRQQDRQSGQPPMSTPRLTARDTALFPAHN